MDVLLPCFLLSLAAIELPIGTEFHYSGSLNKQTQNGPVEVKTFSLTASALSDSDGNPNLVFLIEERGGGNWGWPERFGTLPLDGKPEPKSQAMRILYTHENQQYSIAIRSPVFEFREKLSLQSTWRDGNREYVVTGQTKFKNRNCFQVEVSSNLGRIQSLVVDPERGMIVSGEEKKIIGRGEEYQLKWELQNQTQLDADEFEKSYKTVEMLTVARNELNRTGDQKELELTAAQLKSLQDVLPKIEKEAEGTSWARFVGTIVRDLQLQRKRLEGVSDLQQKMVGQSSPKWSLKLTDGKTISSDDYKDRVVVFHFWQYRGEPLNEPYGQIGYLDFLNSKRKKLGVAVIGVNVDERFGTAQSSAATRSMKALTDFMKISYDVAVDNGTVLTEFGDPRSAGAPLPLWLVIGHDGKVTHYHSGFYSIKPDEGLRQLDEAVIEAVRRQKGT